MTALLVTIFDTHVVPLNNPMAVLSAFLSSFQQQYVI